MYLNIGNQSIKIKDYFCADGDDIYLPRHDGKLWLYINLTDECNATCPFCVSVVKANNCKTRVIDLNCLEKCLNIISSHIYGVSITGGEPMLYPELLDDTAELVTKKMPGVILDLATNGTNLHSIPKLRMLDSFEGVHISRHSPDDIVNDSIFGQRMPSEEEIREVVSVLSDKQKIIFNCVLQKGFVDSEDTVMEYLEHAAVAGVDNTSFIGMFQANEYCRERYVSPKSIGFNNKKFHIWNYYHDYDYCSCSSGSYEAENGYVRFYYRCPGNRNADFTRQLVYSAGNKLLAGYRGEEIRFKI